MRAAFFTIGSREPAARFRVDQYIPFLREAGWDCTVWPRSPSFGSRLYVARSGLGFGINHFIIRLLAMFLTFRHVLAAVSFDLVFLQRRLAGPACVPWFERLLRRASRSLVFDFDDAIYLRGDETDKFYVASRRWRSFKQIVQFSDQIIAGNSYLAKMAGAPLKTTVIPTPIDTDRFCPRLKEANTASAPVTIGWTGTSGNYRYLYPLAVILRRVVDRFPCTTLKIICDKPPDLRLLAGLDVQFVPWEPMNEVEHLQDIDIGLMYLQDELWTRGKCGFKLIEYMSLAKPVVASPVGMNLEIVKDDVNGYLAPTMDHWYEYLTRLVGNARLRERLGHAGRRTVEENFSVRACFPKLLNVFRRVIAIS